MALQQYPEELWGLDPLFRTTVKMYIGDILDLRHSEETGVYFYKNHPLVKFEVMGIVVKVDERPKCFVYSIDDSTGVIGCVCWKSNKFLDIGNIISDTDKSSLPSSLQAKLNEAVATSEQNEEGFSLGDLVQVRGKLNVFRDKRELVASYHKRHTNAMAEIRWMLTLPRIYTEVYDKPLDLSTGGFDLTAESIVKNQTEKKIYDMMVTHLLETGKPEINLHELTSPDLIDRIKKECVSEDTSNINKALPQCIAKLKEEGHIYPSARQSVCYNTQCDIELEKASLELLLKLTKTLSDQTIGVHIQLLLTELRKNIRFAHLCKKSLSYCLRRLEENSDVLTTTEDHYVPFSVF